MRRYLFCFCLLVVLVMGIFHYAHYKDQRDYFGRYTQKLEVLNGQTVFVTGRVSTYDIDSLILEDVFILVDSATRQSIHINYNLICNYNMTKNADFSDVLLNEKEIHIGDYITVQGEFELYSEASNEGEFDSKNYYLRNRICGQLKNIRATIYGEAVLVPGGLNRGLSFWKKTCFAIEDYLLGLKLHLLIRVDEIYPQKEAGIIKSILLGERDDLDRNIKNLYQRNGIIHVLSISGLHISIIGMLLFKGLRRMGVPVWLAALLGMLTILCFGIMTGMGLSARRAIGMFALHMLGNILRRTYDMTTALGIMALFTLSLSPGYFENSGFYFSYLSVLGIGVIGTFTSNGQTEGVGKYYEPNKLKVYAVDRKERFLEGLKQSIITGGIVTWFTMPVLLWFYYEIPIYSVFTNMFVLPFMSLVMIIGFTSIVVPFMSFISVFDCVILMWFERLCNLFEKLPKHTLILGRPKALQVVIFYSVVFAFVLFLAVENRKNRVHKKLKLVVAFVCIFLSVMVISINIPTNKIVVLSVGQGDCIYIENSKGEHFLFDCGSSSNSKIAEYVIVPFLKYNGVSKLNGCFLSHPDKDHVNGVLQLLEDDSGSRIQIENIVISDVEYSDSKEFEDLFERINIISEKGQTAPNIVMIKMGDVIECGPFKFTCLWPKKDSSLDNSNDNSQCFLLQCGEFSMLLTGDIEGVGEEKMIRNLENMFFENKSLERINVLKVAHHGSKNSTENELLELIKPQVATISCGINNTYGHPHKELLERLNDAGIEIWRTDQVGEIQIEIKKKGSKFRISGYKK